MKVVTVTYLLFVCSFVWTSSWHHEGELVHRWTNSAKSWRDCVVFFAWSIETLSKEEYLSQGFRWFLLWASAKRIFLVKHVFSERQTWPMYRRCCWWMTSLRGVVRKMCCIWLFEYTKLKSTSSGSTSWPTFRLFQPRLTMLRNIWNQQVSRTSLSGFRLGYQHRFQTTILILHRILQSSACSWYLHLDQRGLFWVRWTWHLLGIFCAQWNTFFSSVIMVWPR